MKILVGKTIKDLRKKHDMSLTALASKADIQMATLSRIEHGKMTGTVKTHAKIAKVFGLELWKFYKKVHVVEDTEKSEDSGGIKTISGLG